MLKTRKLAGLLVVLMAGGMLELIKVNGGIDTVINLLTKLTTSIFRAE